MSILINRSWETITPESAELGCNEDCGLDAENEEMTFRELVDAMREHPECSSSGPVGIYDWFISYGDTDYRTGEERVTAIHYSRGNPARNAKYWTKAAAVARRRAAVIGMQSHNRLWMHLNCA